MLKGVIDDLIKAGKYIIMSTNQMNTMEEYCQELIILKDGRAVLSGNLKKIKHGYGRNTLVIHCAEDISQLIRPCL